MHYSKHLRFPACLILLTLMILTMIPNTANAAPVFGEVWQLRQPDGVLVDVKIWGDEYYQVVESLDGFTLVRDPATMVICYASLSADGSALESTGVKLGSRDPMSLGLAQHVRITAEATDAAVALARSRPLAKPSMNKGAYFAAITGNVEGLCLLVDFSDQEATIAQADVEDYCNLVGYTGFSNNGSVRDYFGDVSDGNLDYTNYVAPTYYRAPQTFAWYDDPGEPWLDRGLGLMFDVLDQMEADGHDFSQYDSNGDGYIDAINLFYAGKTTAGWAEGMWPGSGWIQDQWSADGVSTLKFQFTGMGTDLTIGTFCHENGHMLGFWPDLYDYYDKDDPAIEKSAGVGQFCLMCSKASATNPVEPCAYLKFIAGWGDVTTYATQQFDIPTPASGSSNRIYKFDNPGAPNEYWLVENRQQTLRDTHIPDNGLAIWHIDTNGNNSNNEMTAASHYLVTLVQADGLWDLENNVNNGDGDDLWSDPGYAALRPFTTPDTDWWDGTASDFSFFDISASGPNMVFSFSPSNLPPVAVCQDVLVEADGDCNGIVTADMVDGGSYDPDGDPITLRMEPPGPFDLGSTAVTLFVTDDKGEFDYCTPIITVVDVTPPVVTCPVSVEIECVTAGGVPADDAQLVDFFAGFTAEDNCDSSPVVVSDAPTFFNGPCDASGGATLVTWTATDASGNSAACSATVTVVDTTPPEIEVTVSPQVLWPPNHKMVEVEYTVTVSDICDDGVTWEMVSVTSNEPDDGLGDGTTEPDIQGADTGTADTVVSLRAERGGLLVGRVYQATFRATDCFGNSSMTMANVYVPHAESDIGTILANANDMPSIGGDVSYMISGESLWRKKIPVEFVGGSNGDDLLTPDPQSAFITNTAGLVETSAFFVNDVDGDQHKDVLLQFNRRALMTLAQNSTEIDGDPVMVLEIGVEKFLVLEMSDIRDITIDLDEVIGKLRDGEGEDELGLDRKPDRVAAVRKTGIISAAPNPFNPKTTISYYVREAGHVDLAVFDISGRVVARLVDQAVGAGEYSAAWMGADSRGSRVASGVYFFRMRTGGVVDIRRVVMIK